MKAYAVVYDTGGFEDDEETIDSIFLDKEKAEAYVEKYNQIPFWCYHKLHIKEAELNPMDNDKQIVDIHGYISKKTVDLEIYRIERKDLDQLKDFTGDEIVFHPGKLREGSALFEEDVVYFNGMMDVTPCEDLTKCDEYIKDIIVKRYSEFKEERR